MLLFPRERNTAEKSLKKEKKPLDKLHCICYNKDTPRENERN
jgi:hypothetical protein